MDTKIVWPQFDSFKTESNPRRRTFDTYESVMPFKITMDITGYTAKDLSIQVIDNKVTVSGKRLDTGLAGTSTKVTTKFSRDFLMSSEASFDWMKATIIDGRLLRIEAPLKSTNCPVNSILIKKRKTLDIEQLN